MYNTRASFLRTTTRFEPTPTSTSDPPLPLPFMTYIQLLFYAVLYSCSSTFLPSPCSSSFLLIIWSLCMALSQECPRFHLPPLLHRPFLLLADSLCIPRPAQVPRLYNGGTFGWILDFSIYLIQNSTRVLLISVCGLFPIGSLSDYILCLCITISRGVTHRITECSCLLHVCCSRTEKSTVDPASCIEMLV
jgi:hypothetical protein